MLTGNYANYVYRRQRGLTLIEVAIVLAIAAVVTAGVTRQLAENAEAIKIRNTAAQMKQVSEAARNYMAAKQADLVTATASGAVTIPITGGTCTGATPSLQGCGFLPSSFSNQNPYNHTHQFRVRQPAANVLEGFVGTFGGVAIPTAKIPRTASLVGPEGGFVGEGATSDCPTGAGCGSYGGWQIASATLSTIFTSAPTSGHLVSAMAFANGAVVPDYLYRVAVPGHPEVNEMFTGLHMDGGGTKHDIDGIQALTAVDGTFTNDLAVGRNLTVTGDATAKEFIISGLGNQKVSQGVYGAGVYPSAGNCSISGQCVTKPTCPTGMNPEIYISPSDFSDNGVGSTISRVESYAVDAGTSWQLFVRVRTETGWVTANSTNGRVMAFTKCS